MTRVGLRRLSVVAAIPMVAILLGAWGVHDALAQPPRAYHEAPMLAERVARGELPPVAERLPDDPAVVEPVDSIGAYGGAWRRVAMGPTDIMLSTRLGYEPLVRWDKTGQKPMPGLASRWDVLDGGRTYVFHLRPGLKWSDGHPLTAEDFQFTFDDVLLNKELFPVNLSWLLLNGKPVTLTTPDKHTLVFQCPEAYGIFVEMLCYTGMYLLLPKHYMSQFHPKYAPQEELERKAKERGLSTWFRLFQLKANFDDNPDLPSWRPFVLTVPPPATRIVAERNPYYWKVDPSGNQLPYLDRIVFDDAQNNEIVTFKAMSGDVDFQDRRIDSTNYALFMENRERGRFRVMRDVNPTPILCYVNQFSKDEELRPILQDKRFRIALSIAINRKELIDVLYNGMAVPSRGVASPYDPMYLPEFEAKYIEYDPDQANRLLDEAGLPRGRDGLRTLPGGKPFRQILNVFPSETGTSVDLWQLVADYWREVGLDFVVKIDSMSLSWLQVRNGNSDFWAYAAAGFHWILDPVWYMPWEASSYFAPLYGRYNASHGKDKNSAEPPPDIQRLYTWYLELRASTDEQRRLELGRNILRQWGEECYTIGICRNELLTIVSNRFKNVPEHIVHDYRVMTPGYIGIEQFYIDEQVDGPSRPVSGTSRDGSSTSSDGGQTRK